jgi:hypothetical protein
VITPYTNHFDNMRAGANAFGPPGRALVEALNAWERTGASPALGGFDPVSQEILLLESVDRRKACQIYKTARKLFVAVGGKP